MDTREAQSKIRDLMDKNGLADWGFGWLRTKRTLGVCRFGTNEIGVNHEYVTLVGWEEIEQVALHEIAHAIAGPHAKHGQAWKLVALTIGVKDPASRTEGVPLPGRYRAVCDTCGNVSYRYKRSKRMDVLACGKCCKRYAGGKYDRRFALTYVDTYATRRMIEPSTNPAPERIDMSETATLSAPELAAQIGTDPKTLRRFLRENDSFRNPGSGKRYTFTPREAESVQKAFRAWDGTRSRRSQTTGETRPKNKNERTAAERKNAAKKQIDALEASLFARGVHISQHR